MNAGTPSVSLPRGANENVLYWRSAPIRILSRQITVTLPVLDDLYLAAAVSDLFTTYVGESYDGSSVNKERRPL
jgi:hypothetical protein